MKSHVTNYSKLLIEELRAGVEVHSAVVKLKKLLQRRRHESLLRPVLAKAEQTLREAPDHSTPTIIVAGEKDAKKYADAIGKRPEPKVEIDPTIIGGYITLKDLTITDNSHKSKLLKWYRSAVAN